MSKTRNERKQRRQEAWAVASILALIVLSALDWNALLWALECAKL